MLKFSVIIPTYNRRNYIGEAIESCLSQTLQSGVECNIIVVDDGSKDSTSEFLISQFHLLENSNRIYSYNNIHLIQITNRERAAARNRGARFAIDQLKSDYLFFLDADDCLAEGAIELFTNVLIQNEKVKVVAAKYRIWFGGQNFGDEYPHKFPPPSQIHQEMLKSDLLALGCTCVHREVYQEIGGFIEDRELSGSEDRVFLAKVALIYPVTFCEQVTTYYRIHDDNTNFDKSEKSSKLALNILKPVIIEHLGQHDFEKYADHIYFNLVGIHNSDLKRGHPYWALWHALASRPRVLFKKRFWEILLRMTYRHGVKKHLAKISR